MEFCNPEWYLIPMGPELVSSSSPQTDVVCLLEPDVGLKCVGTELRKLSGGLEALELPSPSLELDLE